MFRLARCAAFAVAAIVLTGCGAMLADRPMNQPAAGVTSGNAFDAALAAEYRGLSRVEKQQGDHRDADTYALRSDAAAQGNPTAPEDPSLREPLMPAKYKPELTTERQRLISALDRSGRTKAPADAARAQAMYDCWVEQASEDLQPDHIAACRDAYLAAIANVEAALVAAPPGAFLVFFDWDRYNLTPEAREIVEAAAANIRNQAVTTVVVTGHTDTSGSAEYNYALSQRRADTVKNAMVGLGVPGSSIQTVARGQSDPLVPTGDGVREPQNRRVSIEF
jgi:OOP family OmpA-OmpF porin